MKPLRKVRCACCGVSGIHEARGLIKACYERARKEGWLVNFARRPPKVITKKVREKGMRHKNLRGVWHALYDNSHASMGEIAQQVGCAKSTVYQATRTLQKLGLISKEATHSRTTRITGVAHKGHAYRVEWYD